MHLIKTLSSLALLYCFLAPAGAAPTEPASGTLSLSQTQLDFAGGPASVPNVSPVLTPVCIANSVECDVFELDVSLPPDYAETQPNDRIEVSLSWTSEDADFDLYLVDRVSGEILASAASESNPEVLEIPAGAGNRELEVQIVPFLAPGAEYSGKVNLLVKAPASPPPPPGGKPRVVVGIIDSAINPYHEFFYQGNPDSVTPELLAELGVKPENHLKLTRTGNIAADIAADKAIWDRIQRGELYWFVGTNVIAASLAGPDLPLLVPTTAKSPHGVGTSSAVLKANPEAVILFVETEGALANDASHDLVFLNPAVDIISTSYGIGAAGVFPPELWAFRNSYTAVVEMGKLHFSSGGNAPGFTPGRAGAGPWWSIGVSGFEEDSSNGRTTVSGNFPDFVSDFTQDLARCMDCESGLAPYSGTSFSTPRSAGIASRVLLESRRKLGHLGGIRAFQGKPVMAIRDELPVSNWLLRRALEQAAHVPDLSNYDPVEGAFDLGAQPINPAAPWLQVAWGDLSALPTKGVVEAALTHLDLAFRPRTKDAGFCEFQTAIIRERKIYWDEVAAQFPAVGLGDQPPGAPEEDPFIYCNSALGGNDEGGNFDPAGDADGDGIPNGEDNCPETPNQDQRDSNNNGYGDACEAPQPDQDGDGVPDQVDNCPTVANPDQTDTGGDGVGDACETPPLESSTPAGGRNEVASANGAAGPLTTPLVCLNPCGSGVDGFASFEYRYLLPSGFSYDRVEFELSHTPGTLYGMRVFGPDREVAAEGGSFVLDGNLDPAASAAGGLSLAVDEPEPGIYLIRVKEEFSGASQPFEMKVFVTCPAEGCVKDLPPNTAPVAALSGPSTGVVGEVLQFSGAASTDADGDVLNFRFDFGDGTTVTQAEPQASHSYTAPGDYTVTLTVSDPAGASSNATRTVSVSDAEEPPPSEVHAVLSSDVTGGNTPLRVRFDASSSRRADGSALDNPQYTFVFGDGTQSAPQASPRIEYVYETAGQFFARVIVVDNDEDFDVSDEIEIVATINIEVSGDNRTVAQLTVDRTRGVAPLRVTFDGSRSTAAEGRQIVSYAFDFGDGSPVVSGTASTVTHVYTQPGSYRPSLTVTDDAQAKSVAKAEVLAEPSGTTTPAPVEGDGPPASGATTVVSGGGGGLGLMSLLPLLLLAARRRRR
jgi:PKD repeat protein